MASWSKIADVTSETLECLDADSATFVGYLAQLADTGLLPAIAAIQECWAVDEHIKDISRHFAREGFFALASDPYHYVVVTEPTRRASWCWPHISEAVRESQQAIAYLEAQDYGTGSKVGTVGFVHSETTQVAEEGAEISR